MFKVFLLSLFFASVQAFAPTTFSGVRATISSSLQAETEKFVEMVSGERLEVMMQEWEQPLVVDAYATVSLSFGGRADWGVDSSLFCVNV
jgi:hypothetical protein